MQKAILALGCFWEPEEMFHKIKGIASTEVGYCGGIVQMSHMKRYVVVLPIMLK